jgi:hypothetical protein
VLVTQSRRYFFIKTALARALRPAFGFFFELRFFRAPPAAQSARGTTEPNFAMARLSHNGTPIEAPPNDHRFPIIAPHFTVENRATNTVADLRVRSGSDKFCEAAASQPSFEPCWTTAGR